VLLLVVAVGAGVAFRLAVGAAVVGQGIEAALQEALCDVDARGPVVPRAVPLQAAAVERDVLRSVRTRRGERSTRRMEKRCGTPGRRQASGLRQSEEERGRRE